MQRQKARVAVIGTGYIGVATAIGLCELGHQVVGQDIISERVTALAAGNPPYHEGGLASRLGLALASGRLQFTYSLEAAVTDADFILVCVGTPSAPDGAADLSALEAVMAELLLVERICGTIVLRSTVPCGTTDRLAAAFGARYRFLYAPEFLREGNALADFHRPDRIIVGAAGPEDANGYTALYASLSCDVIVTTFRDAELIKACSNAFLAMKISFANEVANLCDAIGGDARSVLRGVGADRRIGAAFLEPGIGFGGPCFEKDLKSIYHQTRAVGEGCELVTATLRVNDRQPRRIVHALERELGSLQDTRVAVWGLTFKAGTDDVRDSLAVRIVDDLRKRGASVVAYDPSVQGAHPLVNCDIAKTALDAAAGADALVVCTEWAEFREVPAIDIAVRLRRAVVVDGRNVLDGSLLASAGVCYRGVGQRCVPDQMGHSELIAVAQ